MSGPHDLQRTPLHLGLGATTDVEPIFTGNLSWYEGYGERHAADGVEGRLVAMHTFTEPWDAWEMHPLGSEVVLVTAGTITLIQDVDGEEHRVDLQAGQCAINEPGTWHTADLPNGEATALFITAGEGTQHRPR
ncbi:MAG: cupin domain-containing protein [Acidimicrobiales bacterium]|nr:cupin domain-containing protein [Acidimicrobiales bacterium]RZV48107.1 MAG: cupin domain-containing protein [Acidimicrobiales bacterium]